MNFNKVTTGTSLNFSKDFGSAIKGTVSFNLNWGMINNRPVDLDAFLVMESRGVTTQSEPIKKESIGSKLKNFLGLKINETINMVGSNNSKANTIYFGNKRTVGVLHHGDDLTGANAKGEFIEVDLSKLPVEIDTLTFAVLSYSGHNFSELPFAVIKLHEGSPVNPIRGLVEHELTKFNKSTKTLVLAQLRKNNLGEWIVTALDKESNNSSVAGVTTFCKSI